MEAARARARREHPNVIADVEAAYRLRGWNARWRREYGWDTYKIARAFAGGATRDVA